MYSSPVAVAARARALMALVLVSLAAAGIVAAQVAALICGSCGAGLPEGALYCQYCGRPVDNPEAIYCWRCGTALPADAHYCTLCGSEACSDRETAPGTGTGRHPRPVPAAAAASGLPASAPAAPAPLVAPAAPSAGAPSPGAAALPPPASARAPRGEHIELRAFVRRRPVIQPPRVITSPTGTILPSLALHASGDRSFGLSDRDHSGGWLLSFGLGGVGEAMVSSSRILHALDMQSHALAGLRVRLPIGLVDRGLAEHLALALNVAATGRNDYRAFGTIPAGAGSTVHSLNYEHRETTLGVAATWQHGRLRLHGALHATDLRTKDVYFYSESGNYTSVGDQRSTYETIGLGLDYALDERTRAIAELRSVPRISFRQAQRDLQVGTLAEYAAGLRFYPVPILGLDATVAVDEEALGLADIEIGFGLHLTIAPRTAVPSSDAGDK